MTRRPKGSHPAWCVRKHCTAYDEVDSRVHRSSPTAIVTEDGSAEIYVHLAAMANGYTYVEISELEVEDLRTGPWHTAVPSFCRSFFLPFPQATSLRNAIDTQLNVIGQQNAQGWSTAETLKQPKNTRRVISGKDQAS